MANSQRPGPVGMKPIAARAAAPVGIVSPAARGASVSPAGQDALTDEQQALVLDVTQIVLDVIGIFEPTPFADTTNAVISAARSDWTGAGLSLVGVIPYVGDVAKAGKFPRYLKVVERAINEARHSIKLGEQLKPLLLQLQRLLHSPAVDSLPDSVKGALKRLRLQLDLELGPMRLTDELANALLESWRVGIRRLNLRSPGRDCGILWSKIGADRAKAIADGLTAFAPPGSRQTKGVVTLEALLDEVRIEQGVDFQRMFNDWYEPLSRRFDNSEEAWRRLGMPIWTELSRKYAASLEGNVRVYVDARRLGMHPVPGKTHVAKLEDAVLYDELDELTDLMVTNRNVTSVTLIDATTGSALQFLDRQVLVERAGSLQ